jgi:hypothetical protein
MQSVVIFVNLPKEALSSQSNFVITTIQPFSIEVINIPI